MAKLQIPSKEFIDGMHKWQKGFFNEFDEKKFRFWMMKWHRRSRKTTLAINLLIRESLTHPNSMYLYCAPTYKQAKSIVWLDPHMLFYWLPDEKLGLWKKNESELYIKFKNNSMIQIKGSDDPGSIRGIDCRGAVLDEWSLHKNVIWTEILRPIMIQNKNRWTVFIYTPKQNNFTIDMENYAKMEESIDWKYNKLTASESKILPIEELEKAKKEMLPSEYNQELECDDLAAEERILITPRMIEDLKQYTPKFNTTRRIISIDPSLGGDECVIYYIVNGEKIDEEILHERNTMIIVGYIDIISERNDKCKNVIIDNIGIGQGIADRLREKDYNVFEFCSSSKSNDKRFRNLRAEGWFSLMQKIQKHEIPIIEDKELIKQLTSIHFEVVDSSGMMMIETKKNIKKNLGYSCDRADAFIYAMYGLDFVEEEGLDRRTPIFNFFRKKKKHVLGSHMSA